MKMTIKNSGWYDRSSVHGTGGLAFMILGMSEVLQTSDIPKIIFKNIFVKKQFVLYAEKNMVRI